MPAWSIGGDLPVNDALSLTTVPTLLRRDNGQEEARTEGWLYKA